MYMRKGLGIFLENCEKPAATRDRPGASDFSCQCSTCYGHRVTACMHTQSAPLSSIYTLLCTQIDGRPSVDFVDFCDLTWRTALYPTHLNARVETRAKQVCAHVRTCTLISTYIHVHVYSCKNMYYRIVGIFGG